MNSNKIIRIYFYLVYFCSFFSISIEYLNFVRWINRFFNSIGFIHSPDWHLNSEKIPLIPEQLFVSNFKLGPNPFCNLSSFIFDRRTNHIFCFANTCFSISIRFYLFVMIFFSFLWITRCAWIRFIACQNPLTYSI